MVLSIPHYKISYAQNFEDLFLAGVLRDVESGFYVDVGANHPVQDSVTKIFYDKGWCGINVEPNGTLYEQLCVERPRDINLNLGLSAQSGVLKFRSYPTLDGLSSFSRDAQEKVQAGYPDVLHEDSNIEVDTLASMLGKHRMQGEIHFLKIDVEGLELEVLLGGDWQRFRPWILCIERNQDSPNNSAGASMNDDARLAAMASFLGSVSYEKVFYDGINDYFIASEKRDIWKKFSFARDVVLNGVPVNHIFIKCIASLAASGG